MEDVVEIDVVEVNVLEETDVGDDDVVFGLQLIKISVIDKNSIINSERYNKSLLLIILPK